MNILKNFDLAIKQSQTGSENTPGYFIGNKEYTSYCSKSDWEVFLSEMKTFHYKHYMQYSDGDGSELWEEKGRPPKMASYASSSRMLYMLTKQYKSFVFEKKLPTIIGGTANLDGYWECLKEQIFVEAKCREPYSHNSRNIVSYKYLDLYTHLKSVLPDFFDFTNDPYPNDGTKTIVTFKIKGQTIRYFDMKQMLCHLLGIVAALFSSTVPNKPVLFLYLVYNPTALNLPAPSREKILQTYQTLCNEISGIDFKALFQCIVDYLVSTNFNSVDPDLVSRIKEDFRFYHCDQNTYASILSQTKKIKVGPVVPEKKEFLFGSCDQHTDYSLANGFVTASIRVTANDFASDEIVEITATRITNQKSTESFHSYVKPCKPLSADQERNLRITNKMLANAPDIHTVLKDFFVWHANDPLILFYREYEEEFLRNSAKRCAIVFPDNRMIIDAQALLKNMYPTQFLGCLCDFGSAYHLLFGQTADKSSETVAKLSVQLFQDLQNKYYADSLCEADRYFTMHFQ